MRLLSGLLAGRESLISHGAAMGTVGDNLANMNTPGFKSGRVEFADMLSSGEGNLFTDSEVSGNGVFVQGVSANQSQGTLEFTNRGLDMAVDGQGMFVLNDGTDNFYSRAGNFSTDASGNLVNQDGLSVMGFTAASPTTAVALNVSNVASTATPTSSVALNGNLDASTAAAPLGATPTTFSELNAASAFNTSVRVVDSLGVRHDVGLHFFHTGNLTWTAQAYVDALDTGGAASAPQQLGTVNITFPDTGQLAVGTAVTMSISPAWANGAATSPVTVDLSGFSQFAGSSSVSSVTADGVVAGNVTGVEVNGDGTLDAQLDSGETQRIGTILLSTFTNLDGLERRGSTLFNAGTAAGTVTTGAPKSGGRGEIRGGALESANVDPSTEFVNLVRFQRGYQAGSKVVSAMNELLNSTIQLA